MLELATGVLTGFGIGVAVGYVYAKTYTIALERALRRIAPALFD